MEFYHEEIKLREKATYSAEKDVCSHFNKINPKKRENLHQNMYKTKSILNNIPRVLE